MEKVVFVLLILLICTYVTKVCSDGLLSIKFVHFENKDSLKSDGTCCDDYDGAAGKCNTCEYMFKFCLTDPKVGPCSLGDVSTEYVTNSDYYVFEPFFYVRPFGDEVSNPMQFTFSKWNGVLGFQVIALDEDNRGMTDHISTMRKNVTINATRSGTVIKQLVALEGERRPTGVVPKLTALISVTCKLNYLIPTCHEYCVFTDDASGHYRCNYLTGKRECLAGWYGDKCDKKVVLCTPRNDSLGHYTCNSLTGEKICLPGWRNASNNCIDVNITQPTITVSSRDVSGLHSTKHFSPSTSALKRTVENVTHSYSTATHTSLRSHSVSRQGTSMHIAPSNTEMESYSKSIETSRMIMVSSLNNSASSATLYMTSSVQVPKLSHTPSLQYASSTGNTLGASKTPSTYMHTERFTFTSTISAVNDRTIETSSLLGEKKRTHAVLHTPFSSVSPSKILPMNRAKSSVIGAYTTPSTLRPRKQKRFDFTKMTALLVTAALFLSLMTTATILLKMRTQRKNRVQPLSLSEKYKQNSARITVSSRMSKCSDLSCPSIRGLPETRINSGIDSGRQNGDGRSFYLSPPEISRNSGRSFKERPSDHNVENKIESFVTTTHTNAVIVPKEAFLVVPKSQYLHL